MGFVPVWAALVVAMIAAAAALWIAAVVSIARSEQSSDRLGIVPWLILVTFAPLVGPILWFAVGSRHSLPV
ncbi:PLDc N-terminal domain-containing protein [Nocardioides sp.]|uniref:PLDc N-terminal domain-containing protein n=1 Tax=Nocardioides sp. TaxID=35761 RepID=UPI00286EA172|nr:PLDc N-terminal domain-containing protein [Nocardioides sp.]